MVKSSTLCAALLLLPSLLAAQVVGPEVSAWIINSDGDTGYNNIPSNVQSVRYSDSNVYVSCTCIPGYDIGPWPGNPNQATNQNFVFRITRFPTEGMPIATPNGHIGVWTNGVSIFNAKDARSYNNRGVWNQNAIVVEGSSFDACLGHPAPNGEYHHHLNPTCLYNDRDSSKHSPIIGYAFDGYPIYGAYGYRNVDGTGEVTRMRSSYRLRTLTERNTLADGTVLQGTSLGPAVSGQYPLGYYIEDFEYVSGLGDLDEHNGRRCVTPEYPGGTYAYFVTLDENGTAAYPYTLGPTYYGAIQAGSIGPGSGHVTPSEPVTPYTPSGVVYRENVTWGVWPNPASESMMVMAPASGGEWHASICDPAGARVLSSFTLQSGSQALLPVDGLAAGLYLLRLESQSETRVVPVVVTR